MITNEVNNSLPLSFIRNSALIKASRNHKLDHRRSITVLISTFGPHLLLRHDAYLRASELDRRRPPTLRTALKPLAHCSQAPGMTDAALQNDTTQSVTVALSSKRLM
jgi:hypothetical protein